MPSGHSAADLVSATLLKLLDPFNTSVTWETGRNDVAAAGRMAHAVLANIFHLLEKPFRFEQLLQLPCKPMPPIWMLPI
ncbi:MAG TPA: hypothetical protein VNO32_45930 [Candidatus Acidoferrum sp.]|nr:hypothetical protein [Candidatus Acidoferrum sp.]